MTEDRQEGRKKKYSDKNDGERNTPHARTTVVRAGKKEEEKKKKKKKEKKTRKPEKAVRHNPFCER